MSQKCRIPAEGYPYLDKARGMAGVSGPLQPLQGKTTRRVCLWPLSGLDRAADEDVVWRVWGEAP